MDTSLLATIIGGIAAVVGLGMAAIAIIASRSTKAAQAEQPPDSADQNPNAAEGGEQMVSVTGSDNVADNVTAIESDTERTSLTDSNPATDDRNAFTDPFAPETTDDPNAPQVWGSVFDDPAEQTGTKWGFDGEDASEPARDEIRPETREK